MKEQANRILSILEDNGLIVNDPTVKEKVIAQVEQSLNDINVLKEATKREILFQAGEQNIQLSEQDATNIADGIVEEGDWSHFNEWLTEEIHAYLKES